MSTSKTILLRSCDGETFEVEEAVALESQTIKHVIEDNCADTSIPLPNVTSKILAKVIEYCKKHVDTPKSEDKTVDDEIKNFDAEFVQVDQATLFDLILAADYLKIKRMLDLTCRTMVDMIVRKNFDDKLILAADYHNIKSVLDLTCQNMIKGKNFDAKFALDLIRVADYLNIRSLLNLTCETVVDMILGKNFDDKLILAADYENIKSVLYLTFQHMIKGKNFKIKFAAHLIQAANYLNIKSLVNLTCQTVADMIEGKTPEEIFVCDALDGWFARKLNQVSTFGAVLDMVTDRPGFTFVSLLALDIASHWLQMYRAYYGNRMFMGYCCVACEVLYIFLFLLAKNQTENLTDVLLNAAKQSLLLSTLLALLLFGWAIKQTVNVIQMKTAANACVLYDINKKQKA
ncbi:hypothetical protein F0562_020209 [Nyssa sinensis]|uniref:SKP1 component POZ domain-containing protein n=1 Tax=Nyssa sinensis TaxID=561372 RepID=A0A5J5BR03_9ASTE|nr:hypothetical protein F0562_020209 [Nyssa sinensis]